MLVKPNFRGKCFNIVIYDGKVKLMQFSITSDNSER